MNEAIFKVYSKLPRHWFDCNLPTAQKTVLISKLEKIDEAIIFIQGNPCGAVEYYIEKLTPAELYAVDFAEYYDNQLIKERDTLHRKGKVLFIYNVGYEKALKREFGSQLLKHLLKKSSEDWEIIFVVSDESYTTFSRTYNIDIPNRLRLTSNQSKPKII